MFDWSDLKVLLAVAEHRSTLAAARSLRVNQSTVQRRLAELDRCFGQPVAARQPAGYRLTPFGESLLPFARDVARAAAQLEHHVLAGRRDLTGVVRVTVPEPLVSRFSQSSLLDRFHARHPGLRVELVMSDKYLDLASGDVDVALRSGDTDDESLIGRKVADSTWAVYASPDYLKRRGRPASTDELPQHDLVGFDDSMAGHRVSKWYRSVAPDNRLAARNNSVLGLLYSARAGVGLAPLPMAIAAAEPQLVQVLGPIPELANIWRLLTRQDLRHTPRVAAFFDFMIEEVETLRKILNG